MGDVTGIEWTDHTFNPWIGCTSVSGACDHCYARTLVNGRMAGDFDLRRRTVPSNWHKPVLWNRSAKKEGRRHRVFCSSLADVFDNQVDPAWRADLWILIASTPWLDWQLLTKRPQNIPRMLPAMNSNLPGYGPSNQKWPWPNVWLGTTVENQTEANRRIPHLLATPAARRFLSCEPLLGRVILWHEDHDEGRLVGPGVIRDGGMTAGTQHDPAEGYDLSYVGIDWVIVGGESGPSARPMDPSWARGIREQCEAEDVPFFFKQWGEWAPAPLPEDSPANMRCVCGDPDRIHVFEGGHQQMVRVGKKAAGNLLDGRQHKAFPA